MLNFMELYKYILNNLKNPQLNTEGKSRLIVFCMMLLCKVMPLNRNFLQKSFSHVLFNRTFPDDKNVAYMGCPM